MRHQVRSFMHEAFRTFYLLQVRSVMHEAFRVASSGKRGPVHIDLPKDIMTAVLQGAAVPLPMQPPPQARGYMHMHGIHLTCAFYAAGARLYAYSWHAHRMCVLPQAVDRKALDHVANLLRVAKKPILYVGQGANDAVAELTALAELCNIPVTTTLHAMGAPNRL
tara:strand:- start:771 stop:1265 length:495 start_codon:yes stop_codon:yes gene_type:complete